MIKHIPFFMLLILLTSCESVKRNAIVSSIPSEAKPIKGEIYLDQGVSEKDVKEIISERGGKSRHEVWDVSFDGKNIIIRKSRTDNTVYPPGAAVESWYRDSEGKWIQAPTA